MRGRLSGAWQTFLGLIVCGVLLALPARGEFVDPRAVLDWLPPPNVDYPVASPVRTIQPVSELIVPRNPPPPTPETKPVEPFILPPRPRKAKIASDTLEPGGLRVASASGKVASGSASPGAHKVIASGTNPGGGKSFLDGLAGLWASGTAGASGTHGMPGVKPIASSSIAHAGTGDKTGQPHGKNASAVVHVAGGGKTGAAVATGTAVHVASGTASTAVPIVGLASPGTEIALASETAGGEASGTAPDAGEGGEGAETANASATPEEVLQEQIQKGSALCAATKFDDLKKLMDETPALGETADGVGWGIMIQLSQAKPNYATVRSNAEKLLAMPGQEKNPVGHWGLANAFLSGKKPDVDKALKSLEIARAVKKPLPGVVMLYWTTRAKKQWYFGLILLAALVGGVDQVKKRRAKAAAAKLDALGGGDVAAGDATEKPAEAVPTAVEPAAPASPAAAAGGPPRAIKNILDKIKGIIGGKQEQIQKLPGGKTLWKTLSRVGVGTVPAEIPEPPPADNVGETTSESGSETPSATEVEAATGGESGNLELDAAAEAEAVPGAETAAEGESSVVAEEIAEEGVQETVDDVSGEPVGENAPDENREGTSS